PAGGDLRITAHVVSRWRATGSTRASQSPAVSSFVVASVADAGTVNRTWPSAASGAAVAVGVRPARPSAAVHAAVSGSRSLNDAAIVQVSEAITSSATASVSRSVIRSPATVATVLVARPARIAETWANTGRG